MHPVRAASFVHTSRRSLRATPQWPALPAGWTLDRVVGLAEDSHGRIYLAHRGDHPLLRFHADGMLDAEIGAAHLRATTAYDLRGPVPKPIATRVWLHGLHVDADDHVWITDVGRHLVMRFSPAGDLVLTLGTDGSPGTAEHFFNQPTQVCTVPGGSFYVTDGYGNSRVVRFDARGRKLGEWGSRGVAPGQFHTPHTIVLDPRGRLVVTDRENDRIQLFDLDGRVLAVWEGLHSLDGLCVAPDGGFYAACGVDNALIHLDPDGHIREVWAVPGQFRYPHGVAVARDGALLVAETGDRWIVTGSRPEDRQALPRHGPEGSNAQKVFVGA